MSHNGQQPIAIIGLSGRFPGADSIDALWANLINGVESIQPFSAETLAQHATSQQQPNHATFVNAGAVMADADKFDASFFGFTPREAELMDPQHRVFLECAWSALEHAGYNPSAFAQPVGVFGGVAANTYYLNNVATQTELLERQGGYASLVAREREFAITRIAYKLNLTGPAVSVNTACSTSGVAIHLAIQSLLANDCRVALVGGARLKVPFTGYDYVENGILSPDGHCRAFSEDAAGTVIGNGVACLVLKRLGDAVADGDTIHAQIIGSAINNDGAAKVGYTAPSIQGQAAVIRAALTSAEIDPETIGYVEAHGTGTAIGDPIEIAGLTQAWRDHTDESGFCAIGSIKTNIGHLDAAAGIAGIIKTILALKHSVIPPSLNFSSPNPQIDFDNSPFYVADEPIPWENYGEPRRAGVSMFGLGGTNAHIILEEAPEHAPTPVHDEPHLFVMSARSENALATYAEQLADFVENSAELNLADAAYTLQQGRNAFDYRSVAVGTRTTLVDQLRTVGKRITKQSAETRPIAFMFAGGGAQYRGMAQGLYESEPTFRSAVDRCAELLLPLLDHDIRDLLYGDAVLDIERPLLALPLLFTIQYACAQLWQVRGIRPNSLIGHSMGEYTAACLAGVFTLADALAIVVLRGKLFETTQAGGMISVPLSEPEALPLVNGHLSIAAVNRPNSVVISGEQSAINKLQANLEAQNVSSRRLRIAVAAHSRLVDPILNEFETYLQGIALHKPSIPFVSNLTGDWADADAVTQPAYWVRHLRDTVRFSDGLQRLLDADSYVLIEQGPGQVLSTLARQHPSKRDNHLILASMRHPRETTPDRAFMLQSVGKLWQAGVPVILDTSDDQPRRRVPLPTYPFERKRHWIERNLTAQTATPPAPSDEPEPTPVAVTQPESEPTAASVEPLPAVPPAPLPRRAQIVAGILETIEDLSGYRPEEIDQYATFPELGFDSLLLTQANTSFGQRFEVKITFRQLFEEAPTVAALADYIEANMPATVQLSAAPPATVAPLSASPTLPAPTAPVVVVDLADAFEAAGGEKPDKGPWKPLNTGRGNALTAQQQRALDLLTERLTTKHAKSKALTEKNRPKLADPRTVAGFQLKWKELVFPIHVERSEGSKFYDVDGNEMLDIVMGFGVSLFGHKPPFLMDALAKQMQRGIEIGPQTTLAGEAADLVCDLTGMDRAAFCNTGSEAVLATMRLARTVTGRPKIATFVGDYHGIFDEVLARRVGRSGRERVIPRAPGIPPHMVKDIILLDYGDPKSLERIREHAHELAAVLVEPVQSRNPLLQPREFLHGLRALTEQLDIALIFDEMITGFRTGPRGAQGHFGVTADIASYGKAVAGGMPIGVVAGKRRFMDALDGGAWQFGDDSVPEVGVTWFAGTFVRHPLSIAAVKASLTHLKAQGPSLQADLNSKTARLAAQFNAFCAELEVPIRLEHFSSWILVTWNSHQEFESVFYQYLRDGRIHITEGRPAFLSTAHSDADIAEVLTAFKRAAALMVAGGFVPGKMPVVQQTFPALHNAVGANAQWQLEQPLTPAMQELWLATQMGDDANCAYNIPARLELRGALDVAVLRSSVQQLVDRHDGLRCTFAAAGDTYRIAEQVQIDVPLVDLAHLTDDAQATGYAELQEREARTPFDLVNGPLVRATLVRLSAENHHLFLTGHHIVVDGWSSGIMLRELAELYAAASEKRASSLPAAMQLNEFVGWQNAQTHTVSYADAQAYWLAAMTPPPPYFELRSDRPRPSQRRFDVARIDKRVPLDLLNALRTMGAAQGATLFATLLAGFKTLLHRLSGETDITLAVASAWQPLAGGARGDHLVADGVNLLPMRSQIDGAQPFAAFLKQVRNTVLDGFEHQEYVYGGLLRALSLPRDPSRNPLTSIYFNVDPQVGALDFGAGISAEFGANPRRFENFDIFYNIVVLPDGLRMECTYNTSLYDATTVQSWHDAFVTLLTAVAAQPGAVLNTLPLLSATAANTQLNAWNDTGMAYRDTSIVARFAELLATHHNAVALIEGTEQLTFGELDSQSNRLANYLLAHGVEAGTPVGVAMGRSTRMVVALLGIVKAGGVYVPLDPSYPAERLAYMAADAQVKLVLGQASALDRGLFSAELPHVALDRNWSTIAVFDDTPPTSASSIDSDLYIIYTSGSTGVPKGVVGRQRGLLNRCEWMWQTYPFGNDERCAIKTSLNFVDSVWEIWGPLLQGVPSIIFDDEMVKDVRQFARTLHRHQISRLVLVPSLLSALLDLPSLELPALTTWTTSGETLSKTLYDRFVARFPQATLLNIYGSSEVAADATCFDNQRDPLSDEATVPIGKPIANTQVYLLDEAMQPVPVGSVGELFIGGDGLAAGYLNQPTQTAARFVENHFGNGKLFRTGDYARFDAHGQLYFVGRRDSQIKLRGMRVDLGEIESQLRSHVQVVDAVVVNTEQRLDAIVVGNSGVNSAELRTHLTAKLPSYMLPTTLTLVDAMPHLPNGKLDRIAAASLIQTQADTPPARPISLPASSALELQMVAIWRDVLRQPKLGRDADFFEHGGHSLMAMSLINRIRTLFNIDLPLVALSDAPTPAAMANLMAQHGWRREWTSLVPLKPTGHKTPLFHVGAYQESILNFTALARHFDPDRPFYGIQPQGLDGKYPVHETLQEMAAHYIAEIKTVQPTGPYIIGGHCAGGWVALEIVCQLQELGDEVAFFGVTDAPPPHLHPPRDTSVQGIASRLKYYVGERRLWHALAWQYQLNVQRRYAHTMRDAGAKQLAYARNRYEQSMDRYRDALHQNGLRRYDGPLYMFRSAEFSSRADKAFHLRWRELVTQNLSISTVDSTHATLLHEPQITQLARALADAIDVSANEKRG